MTSTIKPYTTRAKLPKPLVGMRVIERLLLRHVFAPVPEAKLIVAVICQGISDVVSTDEYIRRRANRFLLSDRFNYLANLVDLNPEFVREVAIKSRYLSSPEVKKSSARSRKPGAR